MNKYIIVGVVVLAAALWFFWPAPSITNYPSEGTEIIAFGDSLVYGTGATKGNDFVSRLSKSLGVSIVNLGVPGDTTADGLARLSTLDKYNPKVVILLLGGNDYLQRVQREETFQNLTQIIEDIHARGAIVLLLGVRGGVLQDNFEKEFAALAKKHHTAYVSDVLDGVLGSRDLMSDQVHPNDAGYARITERVYPVLQGLIAD